MRKSEVNPFGFFNEIPIDINSFDLSPDLENLTHSKDEGLLWKIEKKGIKPSYIFATMHINDPEISEILNELMPIMTEIDTVITETNPEIVAEVMPYHTLPEQLRLKEILEDNQLIEDIRDCFAKIYSSTTSLMLSWQMDEYQPWYINNLLTNGFICGDSPKPSLDLQLLEIAKQLNKKVDFLDTNEKAIELIGCHWPMKEQIALLKFLVKNADKYIEALTNYKKHYLKRQALSIFQLLLDDLKLLSNNKDDQIPLVLHKKIFTERNPDFTTRSLLFLEKGNVLIAMGTGHLFGKNGVLNLLKEQGYTITCDKLLRNLENTSDLKEEHQSVFKP